MKRFLIGVIALAVLFPFSVVAGGNREDRGRDQDDQSAEVMVADPSQVENEPGILVAGVIDDSPAKAAGIIRGDIILEVDGVTTNTIVDLQKLLAEHSAGDTVPVLVSRGGEEITVDVTLETRLYRPAFGIESAPGFRLAPGGRAAPAHPRFATPPEGMRTPPLPGEGPFMYDYDSDNFPMIGSGDVVTGVEPGSPADSAGIRKGDVIVQVGEDTLENMSVADAVRDHAPGDVVDIQVKRRVSAGEMETLDLSATLGSNDGGDAYLGIAFFPLAARIGEMHNRMDHYRGAMPNWGADTQHPEVPDSESEESEGEADEDAKPMSL